MFQCGRTWFQAVVLALAVASSFPHQAHAESSDIPYFIHQCERDDPNINDCLKIQANHLATSFRSGIPELGVTEIEPINIDEISIAIGSGPDGYRANFRDIEAFGVSNLSVVAVRSDLSSLQFQLTILIPRIEVRAKYRSSGVLIMMQASGGGDYWGQYEGVRAKVYFKADSRDIGGRRYLAVEDLKMDFAVKEMTMGIENIHNGNTVIQAALNLMINTNAQELLTEMKPDLKKKLTVVMRHFIDNVFSRVPYDMWINEQ